jgi:hypothetical protein
MSTPNARNAERLQAGGPGLDRARWIAGLVSLAALAGLFVTSLVRAPNPVFSLITAVVALALLAVVATATWRRRHRWRRSR